MSSTTSPCWLILTVPSARTPSTACECAMARMFRQAAWKAWLLSTSLARPFARPSAPEESGWAAPLSRSGSLFFSWVSIRLARSYFAKSRLMASWLRALATSGSFTDPATTFTKRLVFRVV